MALTVWQPWASLIMIGAKPYEFRRHDYRQRNRTVEGKRIVIHAGAREIVPGEVMDIVTRIKDGDSALKRGLALPLLGRLMDAHRCKGILELGAGLGTAVIGTPIKATELFKNTIDSDRLDHHVWAWPMTDLHRWDEPVPCRGLQGFWHWQSAEEPK